MSETANEKVDWIRRLVVIFLKWKAIVVILCVICPRPGYDTSGLILLDQSASRHQDSQSWWPCEQLVLNFLRWDALYFVKGAERNKIYEQEWAFSGSYSRLLRFVGQLMSGTSQAQTWHYTLAGIFLSNLCHLLSSLVLYKLLTKTDTRPHQHRVAFVAAILHILTPASLFMSAPYTESIFSLLNFAGMLQYVQATITVRASGSKIYEDLCKLSSGLLFGLATLMRSNGLLSGLLFVYDVSRYVPRAVSMQLTTHDMRRLLVTTMAGTMVAVGYVLPQYLAYREYCVHSPSLEGPPWCSRTIPGIYTWVQSHYWNVGLFRYWTLPNVPLFVIAAPMLWLLVESSITVLRTCLAPLLRGRSVHQADTAVNLEYEMTQAHAVPEIAIPQLVLAITAVSSFHVQIVNRIASGYPTWYAVVANWITGDQTTRGSQNQGMNKARWVVRVMITYVVAQGMLYANFLPPA